MTKAVVDTNILVSALIKPEGKPAQILQQVGKFELLFSADILDEAREVLNRKRLRKKYHHTAQDVNTFLDAKLRRAGTLVIVEHVENVIKNDPPDNLVLACAAEGHAQYLVSGNAHLLDLVSYQKVEIVTPARFLEILKTVPEPPAQSAGA